MELKKTHLNVGGVKTYLVSAGRGSPVILLHGLGASSYSWRGVLPLLAARHAVWAADIPGFGRSEKPAGFDYSFRGFSGWAAALLDVLGLEKAVFVGNSMGAATAVRLALERPERVSRLGLIGSPFYIGNHPKLLWPMRWPLVGRLYELLLGRWTVAVVAPTSVHDKSCITPELIDEYAWALKEPGGRRAVAHFLRNAIPPDAQSWMDRYKTLEVPALVIRGEHDHVVDRASSERFCREARNARYLHLPECGHAPQEEQPALVAKTLLDFLADGRG